MAKKISLLVLIQLMSILLVCAQLSGNYTINGSVATGGNNYQTFTAAVTALNSLGVSGPVTFTVAAGTYSEQVSLNQVIGASATNTITFDGGTGNASTRILQYGYASLTNHAIFDLNGSDYVRIKNITLKSTSSSYGVGVRVRGTADYNIVDNCIIDLSSVTSLSTTITGISLSNSATSSTTSGSCGSYNVFSDNQILGSASGGAYYGICSYNSASSAYNVNNQYLNNTITDFYTAGIYLYYYNYNALMKGNSISRPNRTSSTTFYGIRSEWYSGGIVIDGNRIFNPYGGSLTTGSTAYGIYFYYNYYAGNSIRNNAIYNFTGNGTHYGIYDYYNYNSSGGASVSIYHNTISLDNPTAKTSGNTDFGIYTYLGWGVISSSYYKNIQNNIITLTRGGSQTRYGIYFLDDFWMTCNNNIIRVAGSSGTNITVYRNSSSNVYPLLSDWQAYTQPISSFKFDQNSTNADPMYTNVTSNMLPTNCGINNVGATGTGVTTDLTGAVRGAIPDVGAFEFGSSGTDAGITTILSPVVPFCAGTQNITVTLKNSGTTTLTSASIPWKVAGVSQTTFNWTGSLASGSSTNVTIGTFNFTSNVGDQSLETYVTNPNAAIDICHINDSLNIPLGAGLTGNYTLNVSGSGNTNFTSLTQLSTNLNTRGVCGPVTVAVAAGTYFGQLSLGVIDGTSSTNTITIDGGTGNVATRIIADSLLGSPTNYAMVTLNGSDYVRLRNLTLQPRNANYGIGVQFMNSADFNIVENCIMNMGQIIGTGPTSAGINMNGSPTGLYNTGNHGNYNLIQNNQITGSANGGAHTGINLYGNASSLGSNRNNQFLNNTITDFYQYGFNMQYYLYNLTLKGNFVSRPLRNSSATDVYGIAVQNNTQNTIIDGNKIHNPFGGMVTTNTFYGVYFYNNNQYGGSMIRNNAIYNINTLGQIYGIYDYLNYNAFSNPIYNNTISLNHTTSKTLSNTDYGIYLLNGSSSPAYTKDVRNNIITLSQSGISGSDKRIGIYYADVDYSLTSNNNLIRCNASVGTNIPVWFNGINYMNLESWKLSNDGAYDQNSVDLDPMYTNILTDVKPTNCAINNMGAVISSVTTDLTGASRGGTPDMGAYEFNGGGTSDAGISALVNPGITFCSGSQNVTVRLKNFGSSTLISATINWSVNGSTQTLYSWTGNLLPGSETNVTIGTFNFPSTASTMWVTTTSPNNSADACTANDTAVMGSKFPGLTGNYTIDPSGSGTSNFVSFAAALTALNQGGVCGPVVFNVAGATFNEQVIITSIRGVSAVNTITFDGGTGNAATRILQFPTSGTIGYGHIELNGADYITFRNMTIKPAATQNNNYFGVLLRNKADYNTIDSCLIELGGLAAGSACNGIVMCNSNTVYSSGGNHGSYNTFRGNYIKGSATGGAYFGIVIYPTASGVTGTAYNRIIGNKIEDFYPYGIYLYYAQNTLVSGNEISRPNRTAVGNLYGIYAYNDGNNIYDKNSIHDPFNAATSATNTFYGIYLYCDNTSLTPVRVSNNKIYNLKSDGILRPIYIDFGTNVVVAHNTITMDHAASIASTTSIALYCGNSLNSATPAIIRNNIISITRGGIGTKYAMYLQNNYFNSNNNVIYLNATNAQMGYCYSYMPPAYTSINAGTFTTLAEWKTNLPGMDVNSVAADPQFVNAATGDLRPTNTSINNIGATTPVIKDFIGLLRHPSTPDPGAYEWGPACSGTPNVYGVNIDNGGVLQCNMQTYTLTASFNVVTGLTYQWQTSTNGSNFSNISGATQFNYITPVVTSPVWYRCAVTCTASSQTAFTDSVLVVSGMSGVYTINPAGSGTTNFKSFHDAVAALRNFGICGPVTFNVVSGTYNGRIVIPEILGSSITNTITFDGGANNAANVIISESFSNPVSYAIIHLDGADNIRFQNITVKTTNTSYGWGFLINNKANNNVVENCVVDLSAGTSVTTNLIGICLSGSTINHTITGNHANNLLVRNNYIKGGASGGAYIGICDYGSTGATENMNKSFINNRLEDFHMYGVYVANYSTGMVIKGNVISRPNRNTDTTVYGIYSSGGYKRMIEGNKISHPFGGVHSGTKAFYGIYSLNEGNVAFPCVISNNQIGNAYYGGDMYGLYVTGCNYASINHNTIVFDPDSNNSSNSGTINGIYLAGTTSNSNLLDCKNNLIHITRPGGTRYGIYQAVTPYYILSDNNNIYVNGVGSTNYIGYCGSPQSSMALWRTATGGDNSSVNLDAQFNSSTEYIPTNTALNNLGAASVYLYQFIPYDRLGNPRKVANPDMGCFEWTPRCIGSGIIQGTPFQGTMRSGTITDFDHLKARDTVTFQINPPTGYTNAGFGNTWIVDNLSFGTVNLHALASADTATTVATSNSAYTLRFSPGTTYTDSMFVLTLRIKSIGLPECESYFQRNVYVAPVPVVDFDTSGNCFGTLDTINNLSTITKGTMSFNWNFGDTTANNTSTNFSPVYTFSHPGVFNVTLKATSDLGYATTKIKQVEIFHIPQPDFSPTDGCDRDSILFTNATTVGGTQGTLMYSWDFGDSSAFSTLVHPTKLYATFGTYSVRLHATSAAGCSKTISRNVTVHQSPIASFVAPVICQGIAAQFNNTSVPGAGTTDYLWTFESAGTSTDKDPLPTFSASGTFNVWLKVESGFCADSISKQIFVHALPDTGFTATPTGQLNQRQILFTPFNGSYKTYLWNFGDGNNSQQVSPSYSYQSNGPFQVLLNVTDTNGCTNTSSPRVISFNVNSGREVSKSYSFDVFPNPFRNNVTVAYTLSRGGNIEMKLFDMTGKVVAVLLQREENSGYHELNFSAAQYNLASGTYFLRLNLNGEVQSKQIVQVK